MKKKFIILIVIGIIGLAIAIYVASVFLPKFVLKENIDIGVGANIELELVASNLTSPLDLAQMPNDNRIFIADRIGQIKIIEDGVLIDEPFLDIADKLVEMKTLYEERGLLGMAFHPQYNSNGKFYVYYSIPLRNSAPDGWDSTMRLSEFTVSQNANKADENSERILLEIDKPAFNHNGGTIAFGKEGYLYISVGDGGNANDEGEGHNETIGNGQDTFSLLGKILRIDVNTKTNGKQYGIPNDNPFSDGIQGLKEVYAYGLRNPWRMSFDTETGELFAGDAGQNLWEEISIIEKGKNYGWNLMEGKHCFSKDSAGKSPEQCSKTGYNGEELIEPIIEYPNAQQKGGIGHTNVGGFVYRGRLLPELYGKYVFADWSSSAIYADGSLFVASSESEWGMKEIRISNKNNGRLGEFILSLGRDADGEIYVLSTSDNSIEPAGINGRVYRITAVQ